MANEDQYDRKQRVLWFLLLLSGGSVLITALMRRNELAALTRGQSAESTARVQDGTTQSAGFREVTPQAAWNDFGARTTPSRNDHTKPDTGRQTQEVAAGSVPGDGGDSCPPDYPVKGSRSRIYYLPDQNNYSTTRPARCFTSVQAAEAAGFRPRKS